MNTPTTLAAFAAGLGVVLAASVGVGRAVGPVGATAPSHGGVMGSAAQHGDGTGSAPEQGDAGGAGDAGGRDGSAAAPVPGGLAVSQDGYTLLLDRAPATAGQQAPLAFRILGPDGSAVTDYTPEHERDLHLIVVRRDTTGFQHLHPARDAAGAWSLPVTLPAAGTYKVFADFTPAGRDDGLTLATDLIVPGTVEPVDQPTRERTATVDGYTVTLAGDLVGGTSSLLRLSVSRDGRPVRDLQPYLGAYGHLVALREGDLAYLHVHPDDGDAGPEIAFAADVPTAGDYRLFLDFQHDGVVRTADFGLRATAGTPASAGTDEGATDDSDTHDGDTHEEGDHS